VSVPGIVATEVAEVSGSKIVATEVAPTESANALLQLPVGATLAVRPDSNGVATCSPCILAGSNLK